MSGSDRLALPRIGVCLYDRVHRACAGWAKMGTRSREYDRETLFGSRGGAAPSTLARCDERRSRI